MKSVKRPLTRSVVIVCAVFIALLIAILSFASYRLFTRAMFDRYKAQMDSVATYVDSYIDHDDMSECADTFVESDTYVQFQAFIDKFIDNYKDVHYVYLMKVAEKDDPIGIYEICTGNSTYEKENDPDMVLHLGDGEADWYSEDERAKFRSILESHKEAFVVNTSAWGTDYTLARPVKDSGGNYYALLCVDVSDDQLKATIYRNIWINIGVIAGLGLLFILLLLLWMRRNVTRPLRQLDDSVSAYADETAGRRDPDELIFKAPEINTKNEVKTLSDSITKLSEDMRDYVRDIIAAEDVAYQDALTHVKSTAAYAAKSQELKQAIEDGTASFALVMFDLNSLKVINDKYGHERGNDYIVGACNLICNVYDHSPVYRVGGDEFIVVLEGHDYEHRDDLLAKIRETLSVTMNDMDVDPWNRYSSASGMAVYGEGDTLDTVMKRADEEMYEVKAQLKADQRK